MKRVLFIGLLLLAAAGTLFLAAETGSLRRRNATWRTNYRTLSRQLSHLRIRSNALGANNRAAVEELLRLSNRVEAAEAAHREEKATNDPLREQIRQLKTRDIRSRKQAENSKAALTRMRSDHSIRKKDLERRLAEQEQSLAAREKELAAKGKELAARGKELAATQDRIRTLDGKLKETEAALAEKEKQVRTTAAKVATLEKQVRAKEAENQKLRTEVDALRKAAAAKKTP